MFCSNCGYELKNGENACPNCGNVLVAAESAPASRLKSTFGGKRTTGIGMTPFQKSDLTPPGVYNPAYEAPAAPVSDLRGPEVTPSAEYRPASTGMGGTAPTTTPTPTPAPAPAPTSTSYDYSAPREYMPAPTTNNSWITRIVVAAALVICVLFLPIFSTPDSEIFGESVSVNGIDLISALFENGFELDMDTSSFPSGISGLESSIKTGAILYFIGVIAFITVAIGVLIGALCNKKSVEKAFSVIGIISGIALFAGLFIICTTCKDMVETYFGMYGYGSYMDSPEVQSALSVFSPFKLLGYGFWGGMVLYVVSSIFAFKKED